MPALVRVSNSIYSMLHIQSLSYTCDFLHLSRISVAKPKKLRPDIFKVITLGEGKGQSGEKKEVKEGNEID
jgi:hypothetical protein